MEIVILILQKLFFRRITSYNVCYTKLLRGGTGPLSADDIPNPVFQTLVEGEYELVYRVEDAQTCYSRDTVLVAVSSVEIYLATPNFKLCKGISIQLDPQPQGGSGVFVNHVWTGDRLDLLSGDNIQTPDFSSAENGVFQYNYYVKDSQGCENDLTVDIEVIDHRITSYNVCYTKLLRTCE